MTNFRKSLLNQSQGGILLIVRLAMGLLFVYHGVPKLMDIEMTMTKFGQMGFPGFVGILVGVVETASGILLILGLLHSLALILLGIVIIVAILAVQLPQGITAGLERDVLILTTILILLAFGPGSMAMDNKQAEKPKT